MTVLVQVTLEQKPGSTASTIAHGLRVQGFDVTRRDVNRILYSRSDLFWHWLGGSAAPLWYIASNSTEELLEVEETVAREFPFSLYAWQDEALEAWRSSERRGVVEAVTGSGKTRIGLAAAWDKLTRRGKVQILVPSIELLHQWEAKAESDLPGYRVGLLGDGHRATLREVDLLVSVVNSARDTPPRGVADALLIVDEVHRYGTMCNAQSLVDEAYSERLGLTATYERADDGVEEYLDPFFGATCFELRYDRAIQDEVVAHFKVALIGAQFGAEEMAEYEDLDRAVSRYRTRLVSQAGVTADPFGTYMAEVVELAEGGSVFTPSARAYIKAFNRRRELLGNTTVKLELLADLVPAIERTQRTLIFTEHVQAAEEASWILECAGMPSAAIHSDLRREDRRDRMTRFNDGSLKVLCAPRVLDEGVDVPDADLGIILAASHSRRQMIQRMGRVLRRKRDGRLARFAVLYVQDTSEDPGCGAHEAFLEEIVDVADDFRDFGSLKGSLRKRHELRDYLNDWVRPGPIPEPRMAGSDGGPS